MQTKIGLLLREQSDQSLTAWHSICIFYTDYCKEKTKYSVLRTVVVTVLAVRMPICFYSRQLLASMQCPRGKK